MPSETNVANQQGSLSKGEKADFVVLSENVFDENNKIENLYVDQVWVNANVITHKTAG